MCQRHQCLRAARVWLKGQGAHTARAYPASAPSFALEIAAPRTVLLYSVSAVPTDTQRAFNNILDLVAQPILRTT